MANTGSIRFPVQLEISNLQNIVAQLRGALNGIKVDTREFRELNSILDKTEKALTNISYSAEKGLIDKSSLKHFESSVGKVVDDLEVVSKRMRDVKFDNLTLTPDQQKSIDNYRQKVEDVRKAYDQIQTSKIKDLASGSAALAKAFSDSKVDLNADTINAALTKVNKKIDESTKKIDTYRDRQTKLQATFNTARTTNLDLENARKIFMSSGDATQDAANRATYSEYFNKKGNFKTGGKEALANWLQQLGLDINTVEQVKTTTASRLKDLYDEIGKQIDARQKELTAKQNKANADLNVLNTQLATEQANNANLTNASSSLEGLKIDPSIVNAYKQMEEEIVRLKQELETLKATLTSTSGAHTQGSQAVQELADAEDNLKNKINSANEELVRQDKVTANINNLQNMIGRWMGLYQVINLARRGIRNIINDIRALDKVITEIAIVTNMTQKQLWDQMNTYQAIAKEYGVSTEGVYTVSQLYYQQGLDSVSVMKLTTETLKMAKIAGLDYSTATDYMTVAIRAFKIELEDAHNVVDVYSNLASKSASSTEELAVAMSKTASSAAAVGSSFENTTAMMAVMIETTREGATNIGSAMKSIISRLK